MTEFKNILLATDFQPSSAEALGVALKLAKTFDGKLTILHVWELPIYPYMEAALNSEMIGRVERSAADRLAEELDRARKVLPDATSKMKMAVPWVGIVDAIDELKPDLVVVGTHGRRGLSHVLLGSVAERIVRLSAVPVLTVRASDA